MQQRTLVTGGTGSTELSIAKARGVLGCEPEVDLETRIRLTAEWYVRQGRLAGVALSNLERKRTCGVVERASRGCSQRVRP